MATYSVRYVHQISKDAAGDIGPDVEIRDGAFASRKLLARALRDAGVLVTGGRLREVRAEADKTICIPSVPGMTTYWHAIILQKLDDVSPNESLNIMRNIADAMLAEGSEHIDTGEAVRLAVHFRALDGSLSKGGKLPLAWSGFNRGE